MITDVTYDMIAQKANELELYVCEFFINNVGDGVCYWNRTGKKEDETIIEACFKWDKQRKGAQTAGNLKSLSVYYERLGVPSDCSLPHNGFFEIEPLKKEVHVFVGMDNALIEELNVYSDEKDAEAAWTAFTGMDYSEFEKDEMDDSDDLDESSSSKLSQRYEGTTIFVTEIQKPEK